LFSRRPLTWIGLAVLSAASMSGCSRPGATLTVSVAASLQDAMAELKPIYERSHPGVKLTFNFGGSGMLEQQIESGAPVDVLLSAAPKPMDDLEAKGLILPETRRDLLHNQIVLVVPKDAAQPNSFRQLAAAKVTLIALGDPASVPAGDYGRQVLESLRIWQAVQPKLVLAKDVRQVLSYVETGNADAGIVYETDARESDRVRVAATAPGNTHTPVIYPVAVLKGCHNVKAAREFVAFLAGNLARGVFTRHGFTTVVP
jgi:molybdate transport system substrate-binding protein